MTFTVGKFVLVIGVALILLASFGIEFGPANLAWLGVSISFASFLADHHHG